MTNQASGAGVTTITAMFDVLQQLTSPPYSQSVMIKLSDLCHHLKTQGAELEESDKEDLDKIQIELVRLCQEPAVDLEVRLIILEVVELRALGWRSNRSMEEFYMVKFREAREAKTRQQRAAAAVTITDDDNTGDDNTDDEDDSHNDDDKRGVSKRQMKIGLANLVLESQDMRVLQLAHQQLQTFFNSNSNITMITDNNSTDNQRSTRSRPAAALVNRERLEINFTVPDTSISPLKYTRETILALANNPQAQVQYYWKM